MFKIPTKETYPSRYSRSIGKTKKAEAVLVEDWKYIVEYTNDHTYNCETAGCDEICRCGTIDNVEIDKTHCGVERFFENSYTKYGSELDAVLDFWFTKIHFSDITWDYEVTGGYYGEELERIFIDYDNDFFKKADTFSKLSAKEKIEYLLSKEYGNILKEISAVEDWELKKVNLENVSTPNNNKFNQKILENYKVFCSRKTNSYSKKPRTEKSFIDDLKILAPLCLSDDGIHYRLIDGRHRFQTLTKNSFELMSYDKTGKVLRNKVSLRKFWIICPKE